jgi:hypothetical protein
MDEVLSTPACLLGVLGPWGRVRNGELTLSEGVLTFTRPGAREPLFRVPVDEVRARMPRLYFGLGLKLTARGKRYRIWFVQMRWGQTGGTGTSFSVSRGFNLKEVGPARSATQRWRTALSRTGT